jgi:hypothetical protein
MVLTTEQYQVLQSMDIPVWELRPETGDSSLSTLDEPVLDLSQASHIVICDVPEQSTPEYRLLHSILEAIDFPQKSVVLLGAEQAISHQSQLIGKTVISFTDVNLDTTVPKLPSLKQQLDNPLLKSVVWSTLKVGVRI